MKKVFLLFVIFIISLVSLLTGVLILSYLDPYVYPVLGISFLVVTFLLFFSSIFCLFFYFIKKIHYRGETYLTHIISSFRQGFFLSIFLLGLVCFKVIGVQIYISGFFLFLSIFLIELFIQNLKIEK